MRTRLLGGLSPRTLLSGSSGLWRLAALTAAVVFCASLPGVTPANAADDPNLTIRSAPPFEFSMETLRVDPGTTVKWTTTGAAPHTITSDGCGDSAAGPCTFDSGLTQLLTTANRPTYEFRFANAGTYAYYCRLHGAPGGIGQAGKVIVGSGGAEAPSAAQLRPNVSVNIQSPANGATIAGDRVNVRLGVSGANARAPVNGQTDRLNGHFNLILDANPDLAQQINAGPGVTRSNTTEAVLEGVRPGAHTLTAVWTYDNNVAPQPPITFTVNFTTTAGPSPASASAAVTAPTTAVVRPPSTGDGGLAGTSPLFQPLPVLATAAIVAAAWVAFVRRADRRA